ncbi:MAG: O-antigen ligase family protein [Blastomonas sp.]
MTQNFAAWRLPVYLTACLILGGASAGGFMANGLLQALGIILIAIMLWPSGSAHDQDGKARAERPWLYPDDRILGLLLLGTIGWIILQLIPLPPFIWQNLPGRAAIVEGDALLGMDSVWRPISIQPGRTLASALSLIPPVAIFLMTLRADDSALRNSIYLILIVGIFSTVLGLVQLAQGPGSAAYFYDITNDNAAVGFFANSNHLATLYLVILVFAANLPHDQKIQRRKSTSWTFIRLLILAFFIVSLIINRSLAGLALLIPVLVYWSAQIGRVRTLITELGRGVLVVAGSIGAVIAIILFFSLQNTRLANLTQPVERLEYYANSLGIAWENFPFGTGLGSFRWVYNLHENWEQLNLTYVNHAHGDFVELLMEGGLFTLILIGGFLYWLARRLIALIGDQRPWTEFATPAAVSVAVILGHSLVDYPARTTAIAALLAMSIAMLARPPAPGQRRMRSKL